MIKWLLEKLCVMSNIRFEVVSLYKISTLSEPHTSFIKPTTHTYTYLMMERFFVKLNESSVLCGQHTREGDVR